MQRRGRVGQLSWVVPLLLSGVVAACGDSDSKSERDSGPCNSERCNDEGTTAQSSDAPEDGGASETESNLEQGDSGAGSEPTSSSGTETSAGSSSSHDRDASQPQDSSATADGAAPASDSDQTTSDAATDVSPSDEPASSDVADTSPDSGANGTLGDAATAAASTSEQDAQVPPIEPIPPFEGKPTKVDLLLVVDNSISMGDKQELFTYALPDLVERLVSPNCVSVDGETLTVGSGDACPNGYEREFSPVTDLHLAVITTSLGGYGAQVDCGVESPGVDSQLTDMAHLLATLPRGAAAVPSAAETGFLSWTSGSNEDTLVADFGSLVMTAGEYGCGWEAPLEAWTRFLVDPAPYTKVTRQPCNMQDTANSCAGPERDENGAPRIDEVLLAQRAGFLRNDSLVSIVMLTDENDCSFKPWGQSWRLAQTAQADQSGALASYPAFRGTAACNDPAYGPNHECCHSCGQAAFPTDCPAAQDTTGNTVALGCEVSRKFTVDELGDHANLRCFEQKRRFGVDYLFPVERYVAALNQETLCATALDFALEGCPEGAIVRNALFAVQDEQRRPEDWLLLVGILGVPWQDLALDPMGEEPLRYRTGDPDAPEAERIDWDWLLASEDNPVPGDPLMIESVEVRHGTHPATGEAIAGIEGGFLANSINGHEWTIADQSDLQYACIFPIAPVQCPTKEEAVALREQGELVPVCDCTDYPGDEWSNPACQAEDGSYDATQRFGKAYPGLRELQVLRALGKNGIVASICPKETDPEAPDFGYRPAVNAMMDRFRDALGTVELASP